jgi:hypothetical protein
MSDNIDTLGSLRRRTFVRNSVITGAAIGSIGTVQADENEDVTTYEPPEENLEPTDIEYTNIDNARAVLYKNCPPWETEANESVLTELGVTYSVKPPREAQNIFDEDANIVVLPSTQDQQFQDAMLEAKDQITEWVQEGGTLIAHMTAIGWPCTGMWRDTFLPSNVGVVDGETFNEIEIFEPEHPVVNGLSNDDLSGWGASSHGYFENVPDDARIVYGGGDRPRDRPAYIEYEFGNGTVIATMGTLEYGYGEIDMPEVLTNELRYAAEGGEAPDGESGLSLGNLTVDSNIDQEAAQGELIEVTATAENVDEERVETGITFGFKNQSFDAVDVSLNPGETVEIFTDFDVGTTTDPGEAILGYATNPQVIDQRTPNTNYSHSDDIDNQSAQQEILPSDQNDEADILLIKDTDPWGAAGNETVLQEMGVSYTRVNRNDVEQVDFQEYQYIILPSVQDQGYYDTLESLAGRFDTYVDSGSVLIAHGCTYSGAEFADILPKNVRSVTDRNNYEEINTVDEDSPVVESLTNDDLSGWNASTHGVLENIGDNMNVVTEVQRDGQPAYVEYSYGSGSVLANVHTIEWPFASGYGTTQLLQNELTYALDGDIGGEPGGPSESVTTELIIRELGDVNHDDEVDITDAVFTQREREGRPIAGTFNPAAADLTQDDTVDAQDVQQILEKNVGNDPDIPQREPSVNNAGTR